MSAYQRYDVLAIDCAPNQKPKGERRAYSTAVRVVVTGRVDEFACGDFRSGEAAWVDHDFARFLDAAERGDGDLALDIQLLLCRQASRDADRG